MNLSESPGGTSVTAPNRALRALVFALLLLVAVPAAAGAATVSVQPYVEPPLPPGDDGFGTCGRYMMCPPDMVVVTAAPRENNLLVITLESSAPAEGSTLRRYRFIVRDRIAQVQAGPGCSQLDFGAAACTAGAIGPVWLGDGDDWFSSSFGAGGVHGGAGQDVLQDIDGRMTGGEGDDVIVGDRGAGGGGNDVLMVRSGFGDSGDDELRCFPRDTPCHLDGGPGHDLLTGGTSGDRLFGRRGNDVGRGGAGLDTLGGGLGDDSIIGDAGRDVLHGDSGTDRLVSREDRSAGERTVQDRVDCGTGRGDRATGRPSTGATA
jgi:hypothetical protein